LLKQFKIYNPKKRGQVSEQKLSMGNVQLLGKKVNEVYSTKDYNKFKFRGDNRIVKETHVKGLIENMKLRGWEPGSYVVINERGEVIDGQHRVKAAIQVGIPVLYTIEKKAGFETIRNLNRNQKNWAITDHIHGFVEENNPHYIKLNNFIKEYKELKVTECMMLCKNSFTSVSREEFESGNFMTRDMGKARQWADFIMSLKPFFKGYNRSIFVRAIVKVLSKKPEFKFDKFLHKVQLRPNLITMCGTVEQYISMIEELYNFGSRDKINLRF
jgi:hypothetical protein